MAIVNFNPSARRSSALRAAATSLTIAALFLCESTGTAQGMQDTTPRGVEVAESREAVLSRLLAAWVSGQPRDLAPRELAERLRQGGPIDSLRSANVQTRVSGRRTVRVVFTVRGLEDDSIAAERYIVVIARRRQHLVLRSLRLLHSCWRGRGAANFVSYPCP